MCALGKTGAEMEQEFAGLRLFFSFLLHRSSLPWIGFRYLVGLHLIKLLFDSEFTANPPGLLQTGTRRD